MIVYNSKLSLWMFMLALPLFFLRYAIHIYFYIRSSQKRIIQKEVEHVLREYHINTTPLIGFIWSVHRNPYFLSLFYYRIGQSRAYLCSFFKKEYSEFSICCDKLGAIKFYHPFSTILNAKSIGDNFACRNNTTVGNIDNDYSLRPVIGNNVELGANVVIFGDIVIGDNVKIGAGTVVNKDVPSNCVVVGNPFRIIRMIE